MINTKRILKCMFCGNPMSYNDLTHMFANNTVMSSSYSCKRYQAGINHGEQQLIIHNNEIIQYHLEFKINNKKYWIKSLKDKNTEFYTYEVRDRGIFISNYLKCISTVPKFFPLNINDWVTDFFNLKTKFSQLAIFI